LCEQLCECQVVTEKEDAPSVFTLVVFGEVMGVFNGQPGFASPGASLDEKLAVPFEHLEDLEVALEVL
jgi:hypothetical protein